MIEGRKDNGEGHMPVGGTAKEWESGEAEMMEEGGDAGTKRQHWNFITYAPIKNKLG